MLKRTDIEMKLRERRSKKHNHQALEALLQEMKVGTSGAWEQEEAVPEPPPFNQFDFDLLETSRIYHLDQIREICIDYRLRFLDLAYFKPELPEEAKTAIAELGQTHSTRVDGMKILAPSRLFKLEDKDDPLLFVPMGNNYFYLIHKWGNDLHPLRRILVWPFKNIANLALCILLFSYLVTLLVPSGLFSKNNSTGEFWMIFFFMFKSIAAIVIYYGFAMGKNFNPAIWNSKYFNA